MPDVHVKKEYDVHEGPRFSHREDSVYASDVDPGWLEEDRIAPQRVTAEFCPVEGCKGLINRELGLCYICHHGVTA